jgi:hypothetical protein
VQVCLLPSVQAGGLVVVSNLIPAAHAGLDLSVQSGRLPSAQLVAPLLTVVSVLVARPVVPSTTTFAIVFVAVGLDPSVHVSGFSVDEHLATVLSVHLGGFPAGVEESEQKAGADPDLQVGYLPSVHIDGPSCSVFYWVDPSAALVVSDFDVPSAGAVPSEHVAGFAPPTHVGLVLSVHIGGVPAGVELSAHVVGLSPAESHDGGLPSVHFAGPSAV